MIDTFIPKRLINLLNILALSLLVAYIIQQILSFIEKVLESILDNN